MEQVTFDYVETDAAKIYTSIIGNLMDAVEEPLYPGDERRIFGEALVSVLVNLYNEFNDKAKQRTLQYARGFVLDAIGARYNVERAMLAHAFAMFRFTVDAVQKENIIIPAGTRITSDGSLYFATEVTEVLLAGETEIVIRAVCKDGGAAYNGLTPGTVATLVDLIPYISGAENTTISLGGDDGEPYTTEGDNRLRERIRLAPATQSTAGPEGSYRYWALTADPDIIDVAVDCPEDMPTVVKLYPLMKGGTLPDTETLQKVLSICSADDVRPMTDKVEALVPEAVEYQIELTYYCLREREAETVQTIEGKGGAIEQYNIWQTSALSRDINPDRLRRFMLAPEEGVGVVRVEITHPSFQSLSKAQVAKFVGPAVIRHEVI